MSNYFCHIENDSAVPFSISNGGTSVFIAALCLAGAEIAREDWQRELLVWISGNEQPIVGRGCVGFDIDELGWQQDRFSLQKNFLLQTVQRAREQTGWEKLPYSPPPERACYGFDHFENLILGFEPDHCKNEILDWNVERPDSLTCCGTHGIFMHKYGCVICNDD